MEETLVYREIEGMEDESCSFVEDAKAQIISTEAELEAKHIWGDDADLFCSYHCTGFLGNLLASLGSREVKDTDFFQTIINYFTTEEINDLYYKILPPFDELARAELDPHEKRPDLLRGAKPMEYLTYFNRHIGTRAAMWKVLAEACRKRSAEFQKKMNEPSRKKSTLEQRFLELQSLFELNDQELKLLIFIFFCHDEILELYDFDCFRKFNLNGKIMPDIAKIIGVHESELVNMLHHDRKIKKYGLLDDELSIEDSFLYYLQGTSSVPLTERFWTKYNGEALPWDFYGNLSAKHGSILTEMIQCKTPDQGHSILFYGVAGAGKTSFAVSLAEKTGKDIYFIAHCNDEGGNKRCSNSFRYAALAVAQRQLDPQKCILVVDECDKMVENQNLNNTFFQALSLPMISSRDGGAKAQLNMVMDENRHTVLWICNSQQHLLDPSSRRRFDYSVFFDEISASARCNIWKNVLKQYNVLDKVPETFLKKISSAWNVTPGGIAVAVKNAAAVCTGKTETENFEEYLMTYLRAHCALLGIRENPEEKYEPARNYTLDGINIRSGIKLPRLISACKKFLGTLEKPGDTCDQPRMNLLLFGVPGSGKTEFVKFLAKKLGRKLNVKNAADLLSEYVGGTEERLASAFAEAEENGEILFIDEGDSMLGSRTNARNVWEVSQVNTLLSEMERFRGIFIVSTNLIQNLDPAAIRRFNFRLHFDYLDNHGKEIFYETFFASLDLPALTAAERKKLAGIEKLTPSDFRNVRQQYFYLEDEVLTNGEVLEALAAESAGKNAASDYKKLGETAGRIGFGN